jgi:predicted DNA-binding transcriptional regulator YafY
MTVEDRTPLDASRVVLLVRLVSALDEGRFDFEGLKGRIGGDRPPSTRTLRRYLAILAEAGFPWFYDRERRVYRFEEGFALRRLDLSGGELEGLEALRGIATSLGGNIGASIGRVTEKLARVAERPAGSRAHPALVMRVSDAALDADRSAGFELLQRAQRERQSVRFAYVDKAGNRSRRHVDPYGFVISQGRVYAIAFDRGRGALRVFALDAIAEAQIAPGRFVLPADFDVAAFAAGSISGVMTAEKPTSVTVRFAPLVAGAAKADRVVRERSIVDLPDGGVEITYAVADPHEFVRWTLRWGAEAEISGPPEVRDEARAVIARLAERYAIRGP